MRKIIILAAAFVAFASCCNNTERELTILHVNDTHSHLDPFKGVLGGAVERAAIVDSVRASNGRRNVLLLHAGDFDQGSSYYTILKGQVEKDIINAMKYDCVTLGNHEFDDGIDALCTRVKAIKCPVVCASYDFSAFELGKYIKPYTVIRRGGYRIGIFGLLTDVSKMVSRNVADQMPRVGDDAELALKWATYLRDVEKCDIVIALTHIGFEEDCALASSSRGIDFIIGGHSHTEISEPEIVLDLDGKEVLVLTDGSWGATVAELKVKGCSSTAL